MQRDFVRSIYENTEAFDNAVCFINETKPIEKDIDEENSHAGKEVKQ